MYRIRYSEMVASNEQAKADLHLLATFISNTVVVAFSSGEQVGYLGSIPSRVTSSSLQSKQSNTGKSMRTSNLLCIEAIQTNNYDFLNETTEQLLDRLAIEGIQS